MKTLFTLALALFASSASAQFQISQRAFSTTPASGCATLGWTHYRVITIPAQSSLSSDLSNYPLLISGTYSYLATVANGGLVQNASGFDVAFFTDNTCSSKLSWQTELYTAGTGAVIYHVQAPSVSHTGSATFIEAYDNSGISTDQSNPTAVWDSNFTGVWHLPNGTTLGALDSTSNAFNGTITSTSATAGQIDGAGSFSAGNINVSRFTNPAANGRTYSAWVKATSFPNAYNCIMCIGEDPNSVFAMMVKSNGKLALYLRTSTVNLSYDGTGSHTLSTATWYHITMSYDSVAGLVGYVNGVSDGTAGANGTMPLACTACSLDIGAHSSIPGRNWNGIIDEPRVSKISRTADWNLTDYNSQLSPSTFYSVGPQF